jgi:hypothetical protein
MLVAIALACSMQADPAHAQRVFVSATGSDGNPCTFALPCRSFQHAHDTSPAGGEIDVLDPAGYGAVTVTKAISIQGHGFSGISVTSGANGITIDAGPTDSVTLNGLLIDGAGAGYNGIVFNSGGSLAITNCLVQNFAFDGFSGSTGNGILIAPTSGTVNFIIKNTIASNNGVYGIQYLPPSGSPNANGIIDHVIAEANPNGIVVGNTTGGRTVAAITNTTVKANSVVGLLANGSGNLTVSIDNVSAVGNGIGIVGNGTLTALLGRSVITGNGTGVQNSTSSHTFYTYNNNSINRNTTDVTFPLAMMATQ